MSVENNKTLLDIIHYLCQEFDTVENQFIKDTLLSVLEAASPPIGAVASCTDQFIQKFNEIKLHWLLRGLSSGLNMEKQTNDLFCYVKSSNERAYLVANTLKKCLAAETPKACVIYGMILARHLGDDNDFTQNELIVCKALENATDQDLVNFMEIMGQYVDIDTNHRRRVFFKDADSAKVLRLRSTCDWCAYNRIFITEVYMTIHVFDRDKNASEYFVTDVSDILYDLVNDVQQIWDYK